MKRWPLELMAACAIAWSSPAAAAARDTDAEQQVLRVDREWVDAEVRGDAAALRRILDDDFIAVYGSGKVVDKETFIANVIGDGTDRIESQEYGDYTVRVAGDTAVVVETGTVRGTSGGKPYVSKLRLTVTYVRRDGRWVALAVHFARAVDLKADEEAIRKADADWVRAAQSKQADAWLAFYTDDAVVLPPNDALANGRESARKSIAGLLALPGLAITWQPTKVVVARSGDLAAVIGAYSLDFTDPGGKPASDRGKLLEVWTRQDDGTWKCSVDTWNSDLPVSSPGT
jgi:uncharacterized protein (TIGR02246 family)